MPSGKASLKSELALPLHHIYYNSTAQVPSDLLGLSLPICKMVRLYWWCLFITLWFLHLWIYINNVCWYIYSPIMNWGKLAQKNTRWPFSIQRPQRRQPSQRTGSPSSGQMHHTSPHQDQLANFPPPTKSIFHEHAGKSDRMGLGHGEEWHVLFCFVFYLRHCRGKGGKEPMTGAAWDEANRDAYVNEGTRGHQRIGVQREKDWLRKLRLRSSLAVKFLYNFSQVMDFLWAWVPQLNHFL